MGLTFLKVMDDIPTLSEIEEMGRAELSLLMARYGVDTVYFAVDGTHRFAHEVLRDRFSPESYFELVKDAFIRSITSLITQGFRKIIVLLHDATSFSRGREYLDKAIRLGVRPLWDDPSYGEFYSRYGVQVRFSGFNELYSEGGYPEVVEHMRELEEKTSGNTEVILSFYSCFLPSDDAVRLGWLMQGDGDKEALIERLYGPGIDSIDVSLYFGKPRGKVSPLLIGDGALHLYMRQPSLYLNDLIVRRAIWYTLLNKRSVRDSYTDYSKMTQVFLDLPESKFFWGEGAYLQDIYRE